MGRINSLRTKIVLIMVLVILALMTVIGAFLISGVGRFYIGRFYDSMEKTFSQEFILSLRSAAENGEDPAGQLTQMLMAQSDLGIDITNRNVYVLDAYGKVLDASARELSAPVTYEAAYSVNCDTTSNAPPTCSRLRFILPFSLRHGIVIKQLL